MTTEDVVGLFLALEKEFVPEPSLGIFSPGRVVGAKNSKQGLVALHPTGFWITVLYWDESGKYSLRVHNKEEVTAIEFLPWNYQEVVDRVKEMLENKEGEEDD